MEALVLAEGNVDWMELIILLLVVGGSALGAVSKKLIAYFSPPKEEEGGVIGKERPASERPPARPDGIPGTALPPSRMPSSPRPPVARPAARPQTVSGGQRPAPPILIERSSRPTPSPLVPVRTAQSQQAETPRPTPPGGPLSASLKQDGELVDDAVSQTLRQLESQLAEIDEQFMEIIEDELGQFESQLTATGEPTGPTASGFRMPRLTQPALRRAIVLNEVLGSPVALRAASSVSIPGLA